jgi:cell division protein FtsL
MKSAYELAMERLQKDAPAVKVTDEQRQLLAELDSLYKAKTAEKELLLTDLMRKESAAGKHAEVESLRHQLATELRRLAEELENKKERVRQGTLKEI